MSAEDRFRRLLRWYPRSWRDAHGDLLIGMMLDRAEHEGRDRPSPAERRAAIRHGSAARLTTRLALVTATAAVILGAANSAAFLWGPSAALSISHLVGAVVPVLLTVALVAILRSRGWLSDGVALACLPIGIAALTASALGGLGWSQAFDEADAGRPATGLGAATWPLLLIAVVTGAVAIALAAGSALRRPLPVTLPRVLVSAMIGLIGAVSVGMVLISPLSGGALALAVVTLAVWASRQSSRVVRVPPRPYRGDGDQRQTPRIALALEGVVAAAGVVAVIWAILPAPPIRVHEDPVARAIVILLTSMIPLLAAVGVRRAARTRLRRIHVWGPDTLAAISVTGLLAAYRFSPDWSAMMPWLQAAAIVGGAAIAWWIIPRAGGAIGFAVGITYAFPLGIVVAPALAVAAPVYAILSIGLSVRRARHPAT